MLKNVGVNSTNFELFKDVRVFKTMDVLKLDKNNFTEPGNNSIKLKACTWSFVSKTQI